MSDRNFVKVYHLYKKLIETRDDLDYAIADLHSELFETTECKDTMASQLCGARDEINEVLFKLKFDAE